MRFSKITYTKQFIVYDQFALCHRKQGTAVSAGRAVIRRCAACIPFDKMTQVGWDFEDSNPKHLSRLLSPQVQGKPFDEIMCRIQQWQGFSAPMG